jgi:hypothetical protein
MMIPAFYRLASVQPALEDSSIGGLIGGSVVLLALCAGLWIFRRRLNLATIAIALFGGVLTAASLFSSMDWWPERIVVLIVLAALVTVAVYQQRRPVLQYLYFCRFPLSIGLLLAGLPILGLWFARSLFRNLFVTGSLGIFLVTLLASLAAWVVLITALIVVKGAEARFGVKWQAPPEGHVAPEGADEDVGRHAQARPGSRKMLLPLILSGCLALPTIATVVTLSGETIRHSNPAASTGLSWAFLAAVLGLACAAVLFYASYLLGRYLAPPDTASASWDLLPLPLPQHLVKRLSQANVSWATRERERFESWFARQGADMRDGYLNSSSHLLPGICLATAFFVVTFAVYAICYFLLHPSGPALEIPALADVLFLLILLGWILPCLSFFFDRFRVPLFALLACLTFLLYFINDIDHYYLLRTLHGSSRGAHAAPLAPAPSGTQAQKQVSKETTQEIRSVLSRRQNLWSQNHPGRQPVLVAVAASGGGITASLWTAKVLTELQREFGPELSESIYGLSTVSGGSVGAMYFIDAFAQGRPPSEVDLGRVVEQAGASSLAATAWGLAYPDFWRVFSLQNPLRPHFDRAWAMEQVWKRTLRPGDHRGETVPTLAQWRADTLAGRRPAALFNATIAETGERLVLSPLKLNPLPGGCVADNPGFEDCVDARTFTNLYREKDLPVTTAARLSATFPFVSPISRARLKPGEANDYHVADGGYYDNYGVVTLVEGLHRILHMQKDPRQEVPVAPAAVNLDPLAPRNILIVEIRASDSKKVKDATPRRGWAFGTAGPVLTLLNVWGSGQTSRNNLDLELLQELAPKLGFTIQRATFTLATEAPLSWHLTEDEKQEIENAWDWCAVLPGSKVQLGLDKVRQFLGGPGGAQGSLGWKLPPPRHTALPAGVTAAQAQQLCLSQAPPTKMAASQAEAPGPQRAELLP